jgi:hypothetical protein
MTLASMGFIVPHPDFFISHRGLKGVVVECVENKTDNDVIDWLSKQLGGNWVMGIWEVTRDGKIDVYSNPHKNSHGFWVYLVRRA